MAGKILIVEDEAAIARFVELELRHEGYAVDKTEDGRSGLDQALAEAYDLILLDIMLPGLSGLEVLRRLRREKDTPVILLTARDTVMDKVSGLDMGADDYITKPFGTAELMARIRTALRHRQNQSAYPSTRYEVEDLVIDFERRLVKMKGQDIHLTQIEYKLVSLLAQNAGRVMTYESIISKIWGPYADNDNQILRVNMAHIRRKLEENPAEPKYIFTEIGVGYRMREE